jgi:cytochrome c-type biogenesis protein CcmH
MSRNRYFPSILLTLLLLVVGTITVFGQDEKPVSDDEVNAIASQLYCPICENIPLDVCPTQACADWRELIRGYLAQGWTEDQIKDYFSTQYGWNVLNVPPPIGINWFIYVGPPLFIAAGVIGVLIIIKKSKKEPVPVPNSSDKVGTNTPKELLDRVEKDLKGDE